MAKKAKKAAKRNVLSTKKPVAKRSVRKPSARKR